MTPSDLDEIRKRCEARGSDAVPDAFRDRLALLEEVERLRARSGCNGDVECDSCDERDRLAARLALLEPVWEAAKEWRLACARKDSTPEEVGGLWAVFVAAIDAAVVKEVP